MNMGRTLRNIKGRLMDLIHGGEEKEFPWASHSGEAYPREKAHLQGYKPSTVENGEITKDIERDEAPRGEDETPASALEVGEKEDRADTELTILSSENTTPGIEPHHGGDGSPGEALPEENSAPTSLSGASTMEEEVSDDTDSTPREDTLSSAAITDTKEQVPPSSGAALPAEEAIAPSMVDEVASGEKGDTVSAEEGESSPGDEVENVDDSGNSPATSMVNEIDERGGERGTNTTPMEENGKASENIEERAPEPSTPTSNSKESSTVAFPLDELPDLPALHHAPTELLDPNAPELNAPVSSPDADAETDALFSSLRQGAAGDEHFIAPADEMVRALNSYNNTLNNGTFFLEDADGVGDGGTTAK